MDPFSIFVSVATLLEVGMRASRELGGVIQTWKGAPPAILALYNEVSDLNIVLDHTRSVGETIDAKGAKYDAKFLEALDDHLYQARKLLTELEILVLSLKDLSSVKKKYKWLFRNTDASGLQHRLREVRARVNELLIAYNVSTMSRVELQLKEVHADLQRNHEVAMEKMGSSGVRIENYTHVQQITTSTYQHTTSESQNPNPEETQHLAAMLVRTFSSMNLTAENNQELMEHKIREVLETVGSVQKYQGHTGMDSLAASVRKLGGTIPRPRTVHKLDTKMHSDVDIEPALTPTVRFVAKPRLKCHANCLCRCHLQKGPVVRLGSELLGRLFVGYSGFPGTASTCDSPACLGRGRLSVEVSYVFPVWFLHYAVSAIFRRTQSVGPSLGLFVTKRIGFEPGSILYATWIRDLEAVKRIIEDDPYAVHYAYHVDGRSALHLALHNVRNHWDWSMVRCLVRHGADPLALDDMGRSSTANATRLMLEPNAGGGGEAARQQLVGLFKTNVYLDNLDLPHITKVILGVCPGNVRHLVRKSTPTVLEMIKKPDSLGYTPLWWAVVSQDAEAVQALLDAGVDVNKGMPVERVPPLSRAMLGGIETVDVLLRGGANVSAVDAHGWQPLHWACRANAVDAVRRLRAHGVDLNARAAAGDHTPAINYAAQHNGLETLRYMAGCGIDIDSENRDGETPLSMAVSHNAHRCLRWLLRRDANPLAVVKSEGSGLLHIAAEVGDVRTVELLARVGGLGLDLRARNGRGMTPEELFAERDTESEALRAAFSELVRSVEAYTRTGQCPGNLDDLGDSDDTGGGCWDGETEDTDEDEEEDEFHDALDSPHDGEVSEKASEAVTVVDGEYAEGRGV